MKIFLRILLLLMTAVLILSVFVGCDEEPDQPVIDDDGEDDASDFFPDVERKDYGLDFNIYVEGSSGPDVYYMDADDNDGGPMDEAVFSRQGRVERYLGVSIIGVEYPDATFQTYPKYVQTAVQNMDGTLDALITHVNGGVPNLISENLVRDLGELDGINLEPEGYWNMNFMDDLELNGRYFLGLSDYSIINTYVIAFNKEMLARYESRLDKPIYEIVKAKEWTLDKMIDLSKLVYSDATGDGKSADDTYGITGNAWVGFCGWLTSCDIPMLAQGDSGSYEVAINKDQYQERADNLISKLRALRDSNYSYFDHPKNGVYHSTTVPLSSGRALMSTASTSHLTGFLDYDLEFGVLPYPLYDKDQANYKSLQWGGYIAVPSYVKNEIMTGETLEMLSFYSENVKITYYEKLLGKQVAEAPDDVAMFDIIWDALATDVGQTFCYANATGGTGLCYTVPDLLMPTATQNLASYINGKVSVVNDGFKNFLKGIK